MDWAIVAQYVITCDIAIDIDITLIDSNIDQYIRLMPTLQQKPLFVLLNILCHWVEALHHCMTDIRKQ